MNSGNQLPLESTKMSDYTNICCRTCNEHGDIAFDINRGSQEIQYIYEIEPYMFTAANTYRGYVLDNQGAFSNGILQFMFKHHGHDLWSWSEYGENSIHTRKLVRQEDVRGDLPTP